MKPSCCGRSICLLILTGFLHALPAASISLTPAAQSVAVGDEAVVAVGVLGLGSGAAPSVSTFDIDLSFNPSILALNNVVFGDPILGNQLDLFSLGSIPNLTTGVGTVNLFELSLDSPEDLNLLQADAFTLVTVTFDTLSVGFSGLGLGLNALGDADGLPLSATVAGGSVEVEPSAVVVPEPSSWTTLLGALIILTIAGRMSRFAAASHQKQRVFPESARLNR